MPVPTSENEVTMSICMGRELRLALEQVKLQRGRRQHRMPSLRSLIEEAILSLVEKEKSCAASGVASPGGRTRSSSRGRE
jgi:hypothetical protein